ncbi:D-hexose-6-phosphate mutarotase [Kitasatospora sp. NPDC052896]|uniref:D-hexose-6-phosphate mutarotase n=1 Tax=Kitasatospora sp. NPDC052896 TaxID=3364061 RepID=UPI0037CAD4EB
MIFTLPVGETRSEMVTLRTLGGIPLVVVAHPLARGAISLLGAQLLAWQPAGEDSVLWLSDENTWTPGVAIRGGIPICWPWFGDWREPMHGFARTMPWDLTRCTETSENVVLTFELRSSPESLALWPHAFTLIARFTIGRTCSVELEARGYHLSVGALHTYLRVGGPGRVSITGLGDEYTDELRDDAPGRQDGPLALTEGEAIDRRYTRPTPVNQVWDRGLDRTIEARHDHHSDVVVWNPGSRVNGRLPHLGERAHQEFVCVETARLTRPMTATPHHPARLSVTLRVVR